MFLETDENIEYKNRKKKESWFDILLKLDSGEYIIRESKMNQESED